MAAPSEIEKLERRYSENPDGRFFAPLADAYRKLGQLDRALELVRAGLQKHPDYLSAHIVLGRCLLDKGTDADAAATFQSVLALDGENIIALKSLAEIAERGGRVDEARQWLQKLLSVDSMNAEAEADLQRLGGALAAPAAAAPQAPAAAAPETSFADLARELGAAPAAEAPGAAMGPSVPEAVAAPSVPEAVAAAAAAEAAPAAEVTTVVVAAARPAAEVPAPGPMVQAPAPEPPVPPAPELEVLTEGPTQPVEAAPLEMLEEASPVAAHEEPAPVAPLKPDIHPLPTESRVTAETLEMTPFDDSLAWGTGERLSRAVRVEDVEAVTHDAEIKTPAVEFMSEIGVPAPEEAAAKPAAAPEGEAPGFEEFVIEGPPDQTFAGVESAPETERVELPANLSGAYSIVDDVPPASAPAAAAPRPDLQLIMPEDVTPPEELARPSAKMVQTVSPAPREEPAPHPPMATETMGDLYLKQGFRGEAADVYRRLLAQRPSDAGLAAKLRTAEAPPPDLRAASLGAESVGTWLKRVAASRLATGGAQPAPPPPQAGAPSPLETAFAAESDGEPAHPAPDAFSLDQIFGAGEAPPQTPAAPDPPPKAPAPALGASFDEFFGAPPSTQAPARAPTEPAEAPKRPSQLGEEDLSAFSAWLQGLKK